MTDSNKNLLLAISKGYYALNDGSIMGVKGKALSLRIGTTGYQEFSIKTKENKVTSIPVHRLVAFLKYGHVIFKKGIVTRHKDGEKTNNTKQNILIGTQQQNSMDIPFQKRVARSLNAAKKRRKLTNKDLRKFLRDRENGLTLKSLANKYKIAKSTASYIANRKTYRFNIG